MDEDKNIKIEITVKESKPSKGKSINLMKLGCWLLVLGGIITVIGRHSLAVQKIAMGIGLIGMLPIAYCLFTVGKGSAK